MAGLGNLLRALVDQLATAHRPTVPPTGERTVIVVIAIAVVLADHLCNLWSSTRNQPLDYSPQASASRNHWKADRLDDAGLCRAEGRRFFKPRSGGFPGGFLDRAFYARVREPWI